MADPNPKAAALHQQGLFHHSRGELPQAMERYVDVLKIDPENADALYYIAVVACQDGQYQQGVDLAKRAIEVGPPQPACTT
jgi:tetratricopeptide (TPR) repeat protein